MSTKPPIEVPQGAIRLNTDSEKLEFFVQDRWYEFATNTPILDGGGRGLVGGGNTPSSTNIIQFITISTLGNSQDFGDLTGTRQSGPGATGNSTRGLFAGGQIFPAMSDVIDFVTISNGAGRSSENGILIGDYKVKKPKDSKIQKQGIMKTAQLEKNNDKQAF